MNNVGFDCKQESYGVLHTINTMIASHFMEVYTICIYSPDLHCPYVLGVAPCWYSPSNLHVGKLSQCQHDEVLNINMQ